MQDQNQNSSPLTPETEKQLDALCQQISIANHLDPEIQSELRTHLEDKLHAYLAGHIPLTQPDALLLAKSHFGNPETIKSLFHQVHPTAHALSLGRKIAALLVATLLLTILAHALDAFCYKFIFSPLVETIPPARFGPELLLVSSPESSTTFIICYCIARFLVILTIPVGLWAIIASWNARIKKGERLWFDRWSIPLLASTVTAVVILNLLLSVPFLHAPSPQPDAVTWMSLVYPYRLLVAIPSFLALTAGAVLWIRWCDGTSRSLKTSLIPMLIWWLHVAALSLLATAFWLVHATLHGVNFDLRHALTSLPQHFILDLLPRVGGAALLAFAIHIALTHRPNKSHSPLHTS